MDVDNIQEVAQPQAQAENVEMVGRHVIEDLSNGRVSKPTIEVNNDKVEPAKEEAKIEADGNPVKSQEVQKPKNKAEAEIARMTRQKYEMKSRIEALEKQLSELKPTKEEKKDNLKRSDFENDDDYLEYREQKLMENIHNKQMEAYNQTKENRTKAQTWEQNIINNFKTEEELEQYAENVSNIAPLLEKIPEQAQTFIYGSSVGSKIVNWFGENPHQLERFLNEHPYRQPQVLLALENHLSKSIGSSPSGQSAETAKPKPEEKKPIGTVNVGSQKPTSADGDSVEDILASIRSRR